MPTSATVDRHRDGFDATRLQVPGTEMQVRTGGATAPKLGCGNHARKALSGDWPRPAAPLIIAALASAQFQRSGTRTQSAASPVCKRREGGPPNLGSMAASCCFLVLPPSCPQCPLSPSGRRSNGQDRSRPRCPGSALCLAPESTQKRSRFCSGVHG